MANKQRGYVEVELGGEVRKLKYDLNALVELEDKLGVTLEDLAEIKLGMKQIRTFVWAGLLHGNDAITEKEVGALIDPSNLEAVNEKIVEAFTIGAGKN